MAIAAVVMGVSGSGKTTVGRMAAKRLGWDFADGDDYHSESNVSKMAKGIPLDDRDREPWLRRLGEIVRQHTSEGRSLILACSALKQRYRETLVGNDDDLVTWIYLKGSPELIARRLSKRHGHFMKADLLASQFEALEEPQNALVLDVGRPPGELANEIARYLSELSDARKRA